MLSLLLLQIAVLGFAQKTLPMYGTVPAFHLIDQTGSPFSNANLAGRPWVADFIYTRCSDECPLLSARMSKLQTRLNQDPKILLVSFTLDPKYDRPKVLSSYGRHYGAKEGRWFFITGSAGTINSLARTTFHLPVLTDSKDGRTVGHSNLFALIDSRGKIRGYYDSSDSKMIDALVRDSKSLEENRG